MTTDPKLLKLWRTKTIRIGSPAPDVVCVVPVKRGDGNKTGRFVYLMSPERCKALGGRLATDTQDWTCTDSSHTKSLT